MPSVYLCIHRCLTYIPRRVVRSQTLMSSSRSTSPSRPVQLSWTARDSAHVIRLRTSSKHPPSSRHVANHVYLRNAKHSVETIACHRLRSAVGARSCCSVLNSASANHGSSVRCEERNVNTRLLLHSIRQAATSAALRHPRLRRLGRLGAPSPANPLTPRSRSFRSPRIPVIFSFFRP